MRTAQNTEDSRNFNRPHGPVSIENTNLKNIYFIFEKPLTLVIEKFLHTSSPILTNGIFRKITLGCQSYIY